MPSLVRRSVVSHISPGPNGENSITLTHGGTIPADTTIVAFVAWTGAPNQGTGQPGMPSGPSTTAGISWHNFGYDDSIDGLAGGISSSTLQLIVYYAYVASSTIDTTTFGGVGSMGPNGPAGLCAVYYQGNINPQELVAGTGGNGISASTGSFSVPGGEADDGYLIAVFSGNSSPPSGTPALATAQLVDTGVTTLRTNGTTPNVSLGFSVWEANGGPYSGAIAAQSAGVGSGQWVARIIVLGQHATSTAYTAALSESVSLSEAMSGGGSSHVPLAEAWNGGGPVGEALSAGYTPVRKPMPLADIRVVWDDGETDMLVLDDDIASDAGLHTAMTLSLFTDRRANDDDALLAAGGDKRGWWADQFAAVEGDKIGSRLWLLDRSVRREDTVQRATEYVREALAWMIEDRVAASLDIDVQSAGNDMFITVGVNKPSGDAVTFKFAHVWASP